MRPGQDLLGKTGDLPYRPCVGVMLINRDGLVFVGRRKSEAGRRARADGYAWQMPQGGIDPGETPYEAALRELYEETNIRTVRLLAEAPSGTPTICPPSSGAPGRDGFVGRRRNGSPSASRATTARSTSAIRAAGSTSPNSTVAVGGDGRLPDLIIPFKRPVYESVVSAFAIWARSERFAGACPAQAERALPPCNGLVAKNRSASSNEAPAICRIHSSLLK